MNLFQLVLKQMRQRALGTWLTLLSVLLGVGLAVAVLIVRAGSQSLLAQTDYGYDLIIGKGSPTQLVLNTVYHIENSPGNIPYSMYENLAHPRHPYSKMAVPLVVGDTYKGRRIIGTLPKMFGHTDDGTRVEEDNRAFQYRPGKRFELADGRVFHPRKFEAVIGSELTKQIGLKIGDEFEAVHGAPAEGQTEHVHKEKWKVVGVLQPTHTSNDRVIFIPLVTSFAIDEHSEGLEAQAKIRAAIEGRPATPAPAAPAPAPAAPPAATKPAAEDEHHGHEHEDHKDEAHDHAHPAETKPAVKDGHDHDHDHGHGHEHDEAQPATKAAVKEDGHDHDHDHDHGDHAHADAETKPVAEAEAHDHDHDHEQAATTQSPAAKDDHDDHAHAEAHAHDGAATRQAPAAAAAVDDHADHGDHDHQHEGVAHAHESYFMNADGTIEVKAPKDTWLLSAILVKTREVSINGRMLSNPLPLKYVIDASGMATAVMPAQIMSEFFNQIFAVPSMIILMVCALVTVVAAVGILVSIYNSVSARKREIAILRALGATRTKVLALICLEAGLIGLVGGVLGLVVGHAIAAVGSAYMERLLGQGFNWLAVGPEEVLYLLGVIVVAVLAGLVPALKAYRTPVATNLVAA